MASTRFGQLAPEFALIVMDGLALARLGGLDDEGVQRALEAFKALAVLAQFEGKFEM